VLFDFYHNFSSARSTYVHFQLRNLLWATSSHDLVLMHNNKVTKWNMMTRQTEVLLDCSGRSPDGPRQTRTNFQISTTHVYADLIAAGEQPPLSSAAMLRTLYNLPALRCKSRSGAVTGVKFEAALTLLHLDWRRLFWCKVRCEAQSCSYTTSGLETIVLVQSRAAASPQKARAQGVGSDKRGMPLKQTLLDFDASYVVTLPAQ
jgi:hypothetical protein